MIIRWLEARHPTPALKESLKQAKVLKSSLDPGLSMQWPINVMMVDEGN